MIRRGRLVVVVVTFLIGCVVVLVVGCSGTPSETSNKKEQGRSPEAPASEQSRCEGTRTFHLYWDVKAGKVRSGSQEDMKKAGKTVDWGIYTTNDLPGCPDKGGLLLGTDKTDMLDGKDGDDEIRGLGANDYLSGGDGNDIIYGGEGGEHGVGGGGGDDILYGGEGDDVVEGDDGDDVIHGGEGDDGSLSGGRGKDEIYGGDGNDIIYGGAVPQAPSDHQPDKLYCGKGKDLYTANKNDQVSSSCEKKETLKSNA